MVSTQSGIKLQSPETLKFEKILSSNLIPLLFRKVKEIGLTRFMNKNPAQTANERIHMLLESYRRPVAKRQKLMIEENAEKLKSGAEV